MLRPKLVEAARKGVQRLGRNIDRYLGETIDIDAVLGDSVAIARSHGWSIEEVPVEEKPNLIVLNRKPIVENQNTRTTSFYLNLGFTIAGQYDLLYF